MAQILTTRAQALTSKTNIEPQIILDIEGVDDIFGARAVTEIVRIGANGLEIGDDWVIGGIVEADNSKDYISLGGTTSRIGQQINIEDGTPNSITKYNVTLVDFNEEISQLISPGFDLDDPISTPADVYFNFVGGSHPEDSIRVFSGIIDRVSFGSGKVTFSISSPDQYINQKIYQQHTSKLTSSINNSTTTIPVTNTNNFYESADILTSYILIDEELMEVTGVSTSSFTVTRGQAGTSAASHDDEAEVVSFYRLQSDPIDIALKTMLSNGGNAFIEDVSATSFVQVSASETVDNAVFFPDYVDIESSLGLVEGDTFTVTGATNSANNVTDAVITSFGQTARGSYVVASGESMVNEIESSAVVSFKSKYNTLPSGASFGMTPKQVDVEQFETIKEQNPSFFADYDYPIKDVIEGDEFLSSKILFPSGLFSVFRKGRSSVVFLAPPLVTGTAPIFDETNVINPSNIQIERSIGDRFYNAIVYRFNQSFLEDKFLAGEITQSAESTNVIEVGNRPLEIDCPGMQDNDNTRTLIENASDRFLQRYKFGAEKIRVKVFYRDAFNLDLGDAVILRGRNLKLTDSQKGNRDFSPRVMEIQDKSINLNTGIVELLLVDTIYKVNARYGRIAPSSLVGSSATTSQIPIKRSFGTSDTDEENEKWEYLVGDEIRVRSADFSYNETTTFNGFIDGQPNTMSVGALSVAPSEDYIVEPADYDEGDEEDNETTKAIHVFMNRQIDVTSGTSSTEFEVSGGDVSELTQGTDIRVHSEDYANDSGSVNITDITGTTITVEDMGFTPSSGDKIDLISYEDGGSPYVYI